MYVNTKIVRFIIWFRLRQSISFIPIQSSPLDKSDEDRVRFLHFPEDSQVPSLLDEERQVLQFINIIMFIIQFK